MLTVAWLVWAGEARAQIDAGAAPGMPAECVSCFEPADGVIKIPCSFECRRHWVGPDGKSMAEESCFRLPAGRPIVRLNLVPATKVLDIVGWIHSITCQPFQVPVFVQGRTVTVKVYELLTSEECQHVAWAALDSVGLGLEAHGKALRIVEAADTAKGQRRPAVLFSKFALDRLTMLASVVGTRRRAVLRAPAGPPLAIREGDRLSGTDARVTFIGTDRVIFEMLGRDVAGDGTVARTKITLHAPMPAGPAPGAVPSK